MSEINLLPEGSRGDETRERHDAEHRRVEKSLEYTPGQTAPSQPKTTGGGLLSRLFARPPKPPIPTRPAPGASIGNAVPSVGTSGRPTPPLPVRAVFPPSPPIPVVKSPSSPPKIPWWKRLSHPRVPLPQPTGAGTVPHSNPTAPPEHHGSIQSLASFLHPAGASDSSLSRPPTTSLLPKEYLGSGRHTFAYIQLSLATLMSVGFIALSFWLLLQYEISEKVKFQNAKEDVTIIDRQISAKSKEQQQATALQRRVDAAAALLNHHVHLTKALAFLESKTIPDVAYTSLAVATDTGALTIDADARSFTAIARQLLVFQQSPEIQKVTITGGEAKEQGQGVSFHIDLALFPDVFLEKAAENVKNPPS